MTCIIAGVGVDPDAQSLAAAALSSEGMISDLLTRETFIAMERVRGQSIIYMAKKYLAARGREEALEVIGMAFEAMAELHGLGVAHMDLQSGEA